MRLGATGMDLTYVDTMADIGEASSAPSSGALFTLTRVPRARHERNQTGWRGMLGLRQERLADRCVVGPRLTYSVMRRS